MSSSPIEAHRRIESLDIIRGFALFGIFLANMPLFQWPMLKANLYLYYPELSATDRMIRMVFDVFVEAKFFSIFAFLFGLGFYLFMRRAEEKGLKVYRLFARRLVVLVLFGTVHLVFFWYGDILLGYALAGCILMFFYKRKPKTILIWILTMMIVLLGIISINFMAPTDMMETLIAEQQAQGEGKIEEAIEVYQHANIVDWFSYRLTHEVIPVLQDLPYAMLLSIFMFLIGLYVGKRGFIQDAHTHNRLIKRVCWMTVLAGLPFLIVIVMLHTGMLDLGLMTDVAKQLITSVSGIVVSLFYIAGLVLLLQRKDWLLRLRPLGYAGRMALTNYLTQTLVGVGIFTGLGFYGTLNMGLGLIICLIVYPLQIVWSRYWLKRYRFGPFEWLWRSLTYGKFQRMKTD